MSTTFLLLGSKFTCIWWSVFIMLLVGHGVIQCVQVLDRVVHVEGEYAAFLN